MVFDAIIIGAGPAGLTAATYLGRFRRRCLVVDDGDSRARWIPTSHNIPGFSAGIGGVEFLATLEEQAVRYGAQRRRAHVTSVTRQDGLFIAATDPDESIRARFILLSTGIKDHLPALSGASEAVMRSLLRLCPICDGFEAIDRRIAVIADGVGGEREAEFLRTYSAHIAVLHIGTSECASRASELEAQGIEWLRIDLADLMIETDHATLRVPGARERKFDAVYAALGCSARNQLAQHLDAACDAKGALTVNVHQETSVAGLYAAGDVVRGLNQVIVAAAEGAIAATDIHNKLRGS